MRVAAIFLRDGFCFKPQYGDLGTVFLFFAPALARQDGGGGEWRRLFPVIACCLLANFFYLWRQVVYVPVVFVYS